MIDINKEIKSAMIAKDKVRLASLRAVKSAFILANTEKGAEELNLEGQIKIIQKQVKQRKEAAAIYKQQARSDLVQEESQVAILESFLPDQMSETEVTEAVKKLLLDLGAKTMSDMGKVMGVASKKLSANADGKIIAAQVRKLLT